MSNGHARFSPSNSKRWLHCTASMLMPPVKEKSSSYAQRGTSLHAMADDILNGNKPHKVYEGYEPTEDDIAHFVKPYVEYVNAVDADLKWYEMKVKVSDDCYGTADCIAYNTKTRTVHVIDFKAGQGVFVKIVGNTQLQIYAIGAINFLRAEGHKPEKILTHVVQPGMDNNVSCEVDFLELTKLRASVFAAIKKTREGVIEYHADEEGCRWCAYKVNCLELNKKATQVATDDFEGVTLSEKLSMIPILKVFIKAVEEKSLERLQQGKDLEGFKLVRTKGTRQWENFVDAEKVLRKAGLLKRELYGKPKPLTPLQINKLIKKKNKDLDIGYLYSVKEGGSKVVPAQATEKAIDPIAEAKKDFNVSD